MLSTSHSTSDTWDFVFARGGMTSDTWDFVFARGGMTSDTWDFVFARGVMRQAAKRPAVGAADKPGGLAVEAIQSGHGKDPRPQNSASRACEGLG